MLLPVSGHLVGAAEIAEMLGVSRQRVDQVAGEPDFPEPEVVLAAGRVWKRSDVERWIAKHPRKRRGPLPRERRTGRRP